MANRTSGGADFTVEVVWTSDTTARATWWIEADTTEVISAVDFTVERDPSNDVHDLHGKMTAYTVVETARAGHAPSAEMLAHCEDAVTASIGQHEDAIQRRDHGDGRPAY